MLLKKWLYATILLVSFFISITVGILFCCLNYNSSKKILLEGTLSQLVSIRDLKVGDIKRYLSNINAHTQIIAGDLSTIDCMRAFKDAFKEYSNELRVQGEQNTQSSISQYVEEFNTQYRQQNGMVDIDVLQFIDKKDESFALQYNYIINNPFGLPNKHFFDGGRDITTYTKLHKIYHPKFRDLIEKFGFYDLMLVDIDTGRIVYSVKKNINFATSIMNTTGMNTIEYAFRIASKVKKNFVFFTDFNPYKVSYNNNFAFVAAPIVDGSQKSIGVLVIQIDTNKLNSIMMNDDGAGIMYGKTGESYIINAKSNLLTSGRFFQNSSDIYLAQQKKLGLDAQILALMSLKNTNIGLQPVKNIISQWVLNGYTGFAEAVNYRNVKVFSAFEPLEMYGLEWGVISEIEMQEVLRGLVNIVKLNIVSSLVAIMLILAAAGLLAMFLSRQVILPIAKIYRELTNIIETGDLRKKIGYVRYREINKLVKAINTILQATQGYMQNISSNVHELMHDEQEEQNSGGNKIKKEVSSDAQNISAMQQKIEKKQTIQNTPVNPKNSSEFQQVDVKKLHDLEHVTDFAALADKLRSLSSQFQELDEEAERKSDW